MLCLTGTTLRVKRRRNWCRPNSGVSAQSSGCISVRQVWFAPSARSHRVSISPRGLAAGAVTAALILTLLLLPTRKQQECDL